ncbi:predicted protein [Streptomyces sp. C]|nr:predicted protein [Streptomyces sp. C]
MELGRSAGGAVGGLPDAGAVQMRSAAGIHTPGWPREWCEKAPCRERRGAFRVSGVRGSGVGALAVVGLLLLAGALLVSSLGHVWLPGAGRIGRSSV